MNSSDASLRDELEHLSESVRVRRSVDQITRAILLGFLLLLAVGVGGKLLHDLHTSKRASSHSAARVWVAPAVAAVWAGLAGLSARAVVRARRLRREEEARFARLAEVRKLLGLPALSFGPGPTEKRAA